MSAISKIAKRLTRTTAGFCRDERGTFATVLGVTVMAASICAGVAVDFSRVAHTKAIVNDALDAAVLAVGNSMTTGNATQAQLKAEFEDFFFANLENRSNQAEALKITKFTADPAAGTVKAEAEAKIRMAFMGLVGTSEIDMTSTSEASFSSDAVEISMVLDVTGSMSGAKLAALKLAASDAVDILIPKNASDDKVRIGLVPYSWSVNAGPYAATATGNQSSRCVTERSGVQAHSDASWQVAPVGADPRAVSPNACPNKQVRGLTSERNQLKNDINGFAANGWTAGHIGVAWSYYMLSENWQGLWGSKEKPRSYGDNVKKIAVLMTDGEFNSYYTGTSGNPWGPHETLSSQHAVNLCTDMKALKNGNPGITIYSVAFQAPNSAKATLKACASPDSNSSVHYFDAGNAQELRAAFRSIAIDIQKLRLTR